MAIVESGSREVGLAFVSQHSPTLFLSQYCDVSTFFNTLSTIFLHNPHQVRPKNCCLVRSETSRNFLTLSSLYLLFWDLGSSPVHL